MAAQLKSFGLPKIILNGLFALLLIVIGKRKKNLKTENSNYLIVDMNDKSGHISIKKDSPECRQIVMAIEQWLINSNLDLEALKSDKYYRAFDFIEALGKGNF